MKTQIWIAVSVYVLVAIVRKRLRLEVSLYTLLQVFSVTVFEKMPIQSALFATPYRLDDAEGNRGKSSGTGAFFSCADSSPWTLYIMCCRHAPFPR